MLGFAFADQPFGVNTKLLSFPQSTADLLVERGELKVKAFLLTQNLDQLETLGLDEFHHVLGQEWRRPAML